MRYMVGITVCENPSNTAVITAISCPDGTPRCFGYSRLSAVTIRDCATSAVILPARDCSKGIVAAYQRTLEKLFIRDHQYTKSAPDLTTYVLKVYSKGIAVPHVPVKRHWMLDAAEELALDYFECPQHRFWKDCL